MRNSNSENCYYLWTRETADLTPANIPLESLDNCAGSENKDTFIRSSSVVEESIENSMLQHEILYCLKGQEDEKSIGEHKFHVVYTGKAILRSPFVTQIIKHIFLYPVAHSIKVFYCS